MHILVKSQDEIKKAPINQEYVHMDSLLQILRPPHRVKKAYQLSPIQCCFIAVYICIEPSQTYGPVLGYKSIYQWNNNPWEGADKPWGPGVVALTSNQEQGLNILCLSFTGWVWHTIITTKRTRKLSWIWNEIYQSC